ncbi:hypothetical protein RCH23_000679 [Cryobacterium sp. CAN_C3]|nr:hypothetical protein [Cryobacterium sp. CAN_C3]
MRSALQIWTKLLDVFPTQDSLGMLSGKRQNHSTSTTRCVIKLKGCDRIRRQTMAGYASARSASVAENAKL